MGRPLYAPRMAAVDAHTDLYDIPQELRASPLKLDPPEPEQELMAHLGALAGRNRVGLASFLGAGAYRHFAEQAMAMRPAPDEHSTSH